jgi:Ras-related protein Rab-5C
MPSAQTLRKIVVIGDANVGKSSVINRFVYNSHSKNTKSTVGACEHSKTVFINSLNREIRLTIWDVSGQEKFRSIANMYFRDADGALIVYDTTDLKSFQSVPSWV